MNIDKSFEEYFSAKKNNINENGVDKVDWQKVRIQAAIAAMQGMCASKSFFSLTNECIPKIAVKYADALVKELKGE